VELGHFLQRTARRVLEPADAFMNRLYGWRYNPFYRTGALALVLLAVVLVTGIYLLFFYRVGAPYESVVSIQEQIWLGRWIRALHRYASDAVLVATMLHLLRMFAQGRSWGPRTLAWLSGLLMLLVIFVAGWTGYVMVWDVAGLVLAREGARLLDALPLFAEPISRTFVGEQDLPGAFFFLNLFLHVALPVGLGLLLWVHVSRVARPGLLPPTRLTLVTIGSLVALSWIWPAPMGPPADLFGVSQPAPFDAFYTFWLPVSQLLPAAAALGASVLIGVAIASVPCWTRPPARWRPQPSAVNLRLCTGCEQCYLDCPFEAIAMRPLAGRDHLVAEVNSRLCVSCGICAGSCAPMGVGPPDRTGRDQLAEVKRFLASYSPTGRDLVIIACRNGAGGLGDQPLASGLPVLPIDCTGSLHSSVVEYLVRAGVGGVLVLSCPPRDCWHREGPKWLEQRLFHGREAELKERVDRRRVFLAYAGYSERRASARAVAQCLRSVESMEHAARGEREIVLEEECEPASKRRGSEG
jgi:ferredoxin